MICAECHASNQDSETCLECGASPLLLGRFRLLEQVGAGASGTTYRAERLEDGRLVAVKEMLMRRADSLKALELFEREAKILERLEHPGIPAYVEDFVHEAGRSTAFYLVQDFVEGKPISERMRHPNTTEEVLKICDEVLEILTYLHSFNPPIIHRDVKPENIIERPDGRLALVDFGSVRAAIDSATGGSTVAGTFGFMAPEQLLGRALPQTDVYAVGALAVALLTGKSPDHFTQNDRSIDLSALKLPDGLRHSLLQLLNPAEQSRPDAADARLILRNTPTARAEQIDDRNVIMGGKKRSKGAFQAYLEMPTPRPIPKGIAPYVGSSERALTVSHMIVPLLITCVILFVLQVAVLPSLFTLFIILIPTSASFLLAIQEPKRRRLLFSEGVLETATITDIRAENKTHTTVDYIYRGDWRGSTEFETASLAQAFTQPIKVGDQANVLVHKDLGLSILMLVAPPKFDSKLLDEDRKVPLLEGSG